jgi:excisionase family DNA binding protein|tara:strand:- start:471 stop:725 length:255 start_codon:yes stop_codon:yes gene_type:complete
MDSPKYVPIEDVAKYFSVSISTIRAWVRQNQIPKDTYIKIGNTYRFCVDDVANALTKAEDPEEEVLEEFQSRARTAFANIDDDV